MSDVIEFVLLVANMSAGLVVIWISLCSLNAMGTTTGWSIRLAYVLLGVGAGAMVLAPLYWEQRPSIGPVVLLVGNAMLLASERSYRNRLILRYASRLKSKR